MAETSLFVCAARRRPYIGGMWQAGAAANGSGRTALHNAPFFLVRMKKKAYF